MMETVRIKPFVTGNKTWKKTVVKERLDERSYRIETANGYTYHRNRSHLKKMKESPDVSDITVEQPPKPTTPNPPPRRTKNPKQRRTTKHKPTQPNEYTTMTTTRNEATSMAERC